MDDAIIILETVAPDSEEIDSPKEWRVCWIPAYDQLFSGFNEETQQYDVNVDYILDYFTEVTIWTSIDLAFTEADRIFFELGHEPTNGILLFKHLSDKIYTEL